MNAADANNDGTEVVLVPDGSGTIVTLPWGKVLETARNDGIPLAIAVLQLLSGPSTNGDRRVYSLRPEDQAALKELRAVTTGDGYFRGFLLDENSKFAHQVALRDVTDEVSAGPRVNPTELAMAAHNAAVMERLDQIQDTLEQIGLDTARTLELLERDATADVVAAITTIASVHETYARTGHLPQTDWIRVAGLEQVIAKRHTAIVAELESTARSLAFTGDLDADKRLTKRHPAQRFADLLHQEALLAKAGLEWANLYGAALRAEGAENTAAVEAASERYEALTERARKAVEKVQAALNAAPEPKMRHWLTLALGLDGRGGLVGHNIDKAKREEILSYRADLRHAVDDSRPNHTPALPGLELRALPGTRDQGPEPDSHDTV